MPVFSQHLYDYVVANPEITEKAKQQIEVTCFNRPELDSEIVKSELLWQYMSGRHAVLKEQREQKIADYGEFPG